VDLAVAPPSRWWVAQPGQFGRGRVAAGADDGDPPAAPRIGGCERRRGQLLRAAAEGFLPGVRYTTDDYVAVQRLVAAGLGRPTLPAPALEAHRDDRVRTVPLPGASRRVAVAVHGEPPEPPATAALLARIRASVAR